MTKVPGARWFRNLRLFPKLLLPFLALILVIGVSGAFFLVRGLASRARDELRADARRLLADAASSFRIDAEYLEDSVYIAANLQGMAEAVEKRDRERAATLADSVRVLKVNINLLAVSDGTGTGLVEFEGADITKALPHSGASWNERPFVAEVLRGGADARGGFLSVGETDYLTVARAIRRSESEPVVGAAIAGLRLDSLAQEVAARLGSGVRIFDERGGALAASGDTPESAPRRLPQGDTPLLIEERARDATVYSAFAPLSLRDRRIGTLAVSVPVGDALASAREAAIRLGITLLAVMAAIVGVGALVSRLILAQVRGLLSANRSVAGGELSARAAVLTGDELGELATGFNLMAEELEESYRDLERKVADRTHELAIANEKLTEIYRAQSEFFSNLSHELRTPLFVIGGNTEMLLDEHRMRPSDRKEMLESISQARNYIHGLVEEILDFKRLEAGRMEIGVRDSDLTGIIADVSGTARSLAHIAGVAFEVDVPSELPAVRADPAHAKKILNNLLSNAVKYTPAGGTVRLSAQAGDGRVEISVSDSGVGIPKSVGDRVFEPFYRVKGAAPQRGEGSSGLGLAVTKELVQAQGGRIWYRSRAGKGTAFTFTLLASATEREKVRR